MKNKHTKKKRDKREKFEKNNKKNFQNNQKQNEFVKGRIFLTSRATGFVRSNQLSEDVRIPEYDLNTALHNDTVKVQLTSKKDSNRPHGKVVEIIERYKNEFVGTIEKRKGIVSFTPDNSKFYRELILVPNKNFEQVRTNQKVLVQMKPWTNPKRNPEGEIIKIIGEKGKNETEIQSIIYDKGFSPTFPQQIEKEAQKIKEKSPADFKAEVKKRISSPGGPPSGWDFRNTTTFTIDPFDAKDFDDALSIKELPDGNYEVGVHIADVTHYVQENTPIDKEAIKRGTSIYLVDRTIPMLPEVLSNDLCSLNPNEDKLAYSVILKLNKEGQVLDRWIGETIINSDKRFSYEEAQEVLDNGNGKYFKELNTLNNIASKKSRVRTKNGSINFESSEVKFELDKNCFPVAVYEKEMFETNELIEDFMLLANKEVAEYIDRLNKKTKSTNPFVYRIHDKPKRDNIIELDTFLKKIGYNLKNENGDIDSKEINNFLEKIQGADEEDLIEKAILKSMTKAIYSTNNIGHYGLAFAHYTHFTSPIRRYPDMMVHRLMKRYLKGEIVPKEEMDKYAMLCDSSSRQEVVAVEAERDSNKYKYAEYMSQRIGQEFAGIITSVTEWGVYVQDIETKAEGLVNKKTLKGDDYVLEPNNYRIIGEKNSETYTLGDKVKIKLLKVDIEKRTLDFEIIN